MLNLVFMDKEVASRTPKFLQSSLCQWKRVQVHSLSTSPGFGTLTGHIIRGRLLQPPSSKARVLQSRNASLQTKRLQRNSVLQSERKTNGSTRTSIKCKRDSERRVSSG